MASKDDPGPGGAPAGRPGEIRLPAAIAVIAVALLDLTLPDNLLHAARYVIPGIELVLLVVVVAANPYRMDRENRELRIVSLSLAAVMVVANSVAFGLLVHALLSGGAKQGDSLLLAALQVWATNIAGFAVTFWELDRGGPVARAHAAREDMVAADFRFSQDEDDGTSTEVARRSAPRSDWRPQFIDYLYVSTTNSSAFSPTDTMPLSPRAKLLMSVEAIEALLISVLVIARGVSLLK